MSNFLKSTEEEENRITYLTTLLEGLPAEESQDFDQLTFFEQDFLASVRRRFDIWQDLSISQEETLCDIWKKYQERKSPHETRN